MCINCGKRSKILQFKEIAEENKFRKNYQKV